jgi:radical SAM-linked protein
VLVFAGQGIAQKVQLRFSKTGSARFLSHHDMMRLFARACRRAAIPLRLTQGFDPRPRMVFATALELGVSSRAEVLEMELSRWLPPDRIRAQLESELPGGIGLGEVRLLPPRRAGERAVEMTYEVAPPGGPEAVDITPARIEALLSASELPYDRQRRKRVQHLDLRPSILSLEIDDRQVTMRLQPTSSGAARPAEVLELLSGRPAAETKRWPTTKTTMQMAP